MLKNIKAAYFIQLLFPYVDEKQKLKIVKCNKSLQKNIGISIINYKLFIGKYLIYESNGIGKEYNCEDDRLIFEGEYLNGKRSGKRKEYYNNGKLRIEGVYLYNYKLKGKYYVNENLEYEGECRSPERQVCQVLAMENCFENQVLSQAIAL